MNSVAFECTTISSWPFDAFNTSAAKAREFLDGQLIPYFESPSRAESIRAAVEAAGLGAIVGPDDFGLDPILAVHDAGYIDYLPPV